jgi:predicted component of type VI protein secretion system
MRLSVQIEFDKTLEFETQRTSVMVGRTPENDFVIEHGSISRKHCQIDFERGAFFITDFGSSNGTKLDGQKINPEIRTRLFPSQQLVLGKLECEISQSFLASLTNPQVLSSLVSTNGDCTTSLILGRIDLHQPVPRQPLVKPNQNNGLKNPPIRTGNNSKSAKKKKSKEAYIFGFLTLAVILAWLMSPN